MSAQIIEEDQERLLQEREEQRRKQEGERVGLREEERWRLDMTAVRRKERGKVGGLIDDRGKVGRLSYSRFLGTTAVNPDIHPTLFFPSPDR